MKKIAVITNHVDDVICFRKELIEELYNKGNKIVISCPYGEKIKLLKNIEYKYDDVKIDRRGTNLLSDLKLFLHYLKFLRKYKPDIILCYTIKPNIYASIAARIIKIEYINNITGFGSILNKGNVLKKVIFRMLKVALKKSKCVFFQNETNMNLAIKNKLVKENYKLIPGSGVNTEKFKLQEYPENDDVIIFNYIGRVLKEKGVDDYIEAAKQIKQKYKNTEFNIIGFIEPTESHYIEDFKELEKQDIIKYRGEQQDVIPFIKRAHAIIHPSKYGEGMSNVLLENASSGRPIITTNNPGCFETVDNEITGYIFEKGNIKELVKRIEQFINLKHEQKNNMGILGREKMIKSFNRKIVINNYLYEIEKAGTL